MGFQIFVSLSQKLPKKFHNHDVEKVKKFQRSNARRFKLFRKNHRGGGGGTPPPPTVIGLKIFRLSLKSHPFCVILYIQDSTLNTNRCENRNAENH